MTSKLSVPHGKSGLPNLHDRQLRRFDPRFQHALRHLTMRHARIGDLAVSFPALLFALAVPRRGFDPEPAIAGVIAGLPLSETAAVAEVAMWLRKLPPESFTHPIRQLPDGNPFRRKIANHLPQPPKSASVWLHAVTDVAELGHEAAAVWIARELVRKPPRAIPACLRLVSLWSWFSSQPATFGYQLINRPWTSDMHLDSAIAAAEEWRAMVALHANLGPRPIDDMWLQAACVAGYDFLPLNSITAVAEEAVAMQNCLRTYGANLAHNRSRLWSVRRDGERIATLRVASHFQDPLLSIVELKGPGNAPVSRELWWVSRQWLQRHDLLHVEMKQHNWGTASLDRPTWLSLWRPYWLAKRHIPEWLPIAPSRKALEVL